MNYEPELKRYRQLAWDARAERAILDAADEIVALWECPKIRGLPRSERNAAIEEARNRLIEAVHIRTTE